jgi:hypothetical protein
MNERRIAVAKDDGARLVANMLARHNKTFYCAVALSPWLAERERQQPADESAVGPPRGRGARK